MQRQSIVPGMAVEVKKKAFAGCGSLSSVYEEAPKNRFAKVIGPHPEYSGLIRIRMVDDGEEWSVYPSELKADRMARYYLYQGNHGIIVVESRDYDLDKDHFYGRVVCIVTGNVWELGHVSGDWDPHQFELCNFQVKGM